MRGNKQIRRLLILGATVLGSVLTLGAAPALANAPNPIAGTTVVDSVVHNSDGTITVTVHGQWNWASQLACPQNRNGVGYQVDWFDGNTSNAIGNAKSPNGVLYVGGPVFPGGPNDNIVHSIETLGEASWTGPYSPNATYDGVPSSYIAHDSTDSTPNKTDAANWFSNCDNVDSSGVSSGTWGPISHTYPAGTSSIKLCPIMYDPHGGRDNSGKSSVQDITAGGQGHNDDNSYEGNGTTASGNQCLISTFSTPPPSSPPPPATTPTPTSTPTPTPATTPTTAVKPVTKKKHKKHHVKAKRISRKPKVKSGFTG